MTATIEPTTPRYLRPTKAEEVFNRMVRRATAMGISVAGSRELRVVGRTSGEVRSNAVNPLTLDGECYLVSPRGITQWVRNLRVAGQGELKIGRKVEAFRYEELADADKTEVLREYLAKWAWEVGKFFEGIDASSTDEELLAIAPGFPVFRLLPA